MALLESLYQCIFPVVARHVARRGGTFEEAKDVFHDALLIYYEKARDRQLTLQRSEAAYVYGVARHLWTKRYKENLRYASLDQLMGSYNDDGSSPEWADDASTPEADRVVNRVARILNAAGRKCMELLTAFYYEKLAMEEVATRFGFSGTRSATVQKFKCLEKVRRVVKEKSLQYEDFVG
ncbi:RNA polymerase sigma factor [Parapedobacter deserti]|uniref:RNA polymerase sigma factor n=1 Tax=Parapedobacter deserti TaxID=1912957 RepID=A0ABV7JM06_9SPHI